MPFKRPPTSTTARLRTIERLEERLALSAAPLGAETLINDLIVRQQSTVHASQAVAASETQQVIVFEGKGTVDRAGIFAEIRGADGGELVASFQVNTTIHGAQSAPTVAMASDGSFVVAWAGRGIDAEDGTGDKHGILFRRFAADGTALTGEVLVNTTTGGVQLDPTLAMADDGSFVVAWSGAGVTDAAGVFFQRFDSSGTAVGSETSANTTTADDQTGASVAFDAAGNIVVAWQSRHQDGSDWGIFGQWFTATGTAIGAETQLNSTTAERQEEVTLANDPRGGVVAAWQSFGQDGDGWGVYARHFANGGGATAAEVQLHDTTVGNQQEVALAVADDGQWFVAWSSGEADGAGWETLVRNFEANGTGNATETVHSENLSGSDSGAQQGPSVAIAADQATLVWTGRGEEEWQGVYARNYQVTLIDNGEPAAPDLAPIADEQAPVNTELEITVTATDDNPLDKLTFVLDYDDSPETATIEQIDDNTAVVRWTPTPLEANQDVSFRVLVTDDGQQPLADSQSFVVSVGDSAPADLTAFAQALTDANVVLYGAGWCPHCTAQKVLFEDGAQLLDFQEVTNPDRTPNDLAGEKNVTVYPTWIFGDDSRLEGEQSLQKIAQQAGVLIPSGEDPFLAELPDTTLLVGSPLLVSLDGYDPDGTPLTYTVTSDNPDVTAEILSGNRSARINVAGFGDVVFELLETEASRATERMIELADSGFYEGIIFHRVVNDFIIQGGDPLGTGQGGSDLGDFDDQFDPDLQFNRTGLLAMAKTTDDTNDSQFFITEGTARHLDFNHTIFGVLVEGESNRDAISNTAVSGPADSPKPVIDVVMEGIDIFEDTENAVLKLKAADGATGTANITVTVEDAQGNTVQRTFQVTLAEDTVNDPPFLEDIAPVSLPRNTVAEVQLSAIDVENDPVFFTLANQGNVEFTSEVSDTGLLKVTPPTDFMGTLTVEVGVGSVAESPDDIQLLDIEFT